MILTPRLPATRHSDCLLFCKHQENTGGTYACWYGCKHLEIQPKKRHPNDNGTSAAKGESSKEKS